MARDVCPTCNEPPAVTRFQRLELSLLLCNHRCAESPLFGNGLRVVRGKGQELNSASRSRSLGSPPLRQTPALACSCRVSIPMVGIFHQPYSWMTAVCDSCAVLVHTLVCGWKHCLASNSTATAPRPSFLTVPRGSNHKWHGPSACVSLSPCRREHGEGCRTSSAYRCGNPTLQSLAPMLDNNGSTLPSHAYPCCSSPDNPSLLAVNILPKDIPTLQDRCLRPGSADAHHLLQFIDWRPLRRVARLVTFD